jgi:hypothetical protein
MVGVKSYCQKDGLFCKVSVAEAGYKLLIEDWSHSNHATYFYAQLAAIKLVADDGAGAQDALNRYFSYQFMDHIATSGEQPFEAVRANPYHYRCFNLEAMIVSQRTVVRLGR